jgi:acyl dehydratase
VFDYDPSLIAKEFEVTEPVAITREMIRDFCEATGDTNPLYLDEDAAARGRWGGIVAPPSFAIAFRTQRHFLDVLPNFKRLGFDAGKDVEFIEPIRPGDHITLSAAIKEIYEKTGRSGSMVFIVVRSTLRNQGGKVLAHIDHRFMSRG